ncbi:helix-turn-helix domain-containing protein [Streptomyces sp. NPDC052042]|uniref:helix-turn-helix domain-containing protein n=1 Tax=Streptomyces sp. NPDC052042 TaxID=3365683 RepID=UPI0037CEC4DB
MDTPQVTAPPCPPPPVPGDRAPSSGVIHVNFRHAAGYTVIGNHLAQHRGLSLTAIGLATHIQSLPAGVRIGIKRLAERFPESETRIAAALRELEAHGYLHRSRVRLADGRIVTRTVSYNQPGATAHSLTVPRPRTAPGKPAPRPTPTPAPASAPPPAPTSAPEPHPGPSTAVIPAPAPAPGVAPATPPASAPQPHPTSAARTTPPPPLPQPQKFTPELQRTATALLADLRRHAPGLTLSGSDVAALAPGVATWLERDAHPDAIRHTLTADLPNPLKHPARLLRHRITALLPPPLPGAAELTPPRHGVVITPLQNCDTCDRAFRAADPGRCRDCRDRPTKQAAPHRAA